MSLYDPLESKFIRLVYSWVYSLICAYSVIVAGWEGSWKSDFCERRRKGPSGKEQCSSTLSSCSAPHQASLFTLGRFQGRAVPHHAVPVVSQVQSLNETWTHLQGCAPSLGSSLGTNLRVWSPASLKKFLHCCWGVAFFFTKWYT